MNDRFRDEQQGEAKNTSAQPSGLTRRDVLKSGALVGGALALPSLAGSLVTGAQAATQSTSPMVAPLYYPLSSFTPDIDLHGKLAVITGASRGNGRAIGEALLARGVDVIGTSRNPAGVPNPPAYPLLPLDVADPASVVLFGRRLSTHPTFRRHRQIDILINNAGRFVFGEIIPRSSVDSIFYTVQRELAVRTLYSGHVMTTNVMLPLMAQQGYSRIAFTVSIASYYTGATVPGSSIIDAYGSSKTALRTYANNLGAALHDGGSSIRVSTVNPYVMNTALAEHPNPIYTQPVNANGLSDTDPIFNATVTAIRQFLANGQPPSQVGETYAQLLSMSDPAPNVVVASPQEPLATKGGTAFIAAQLAAENLTSAVPFQC